MAQDTPGPPDQQEFFNSIPAKPFIPSLEMIQEESEVSDGSTGKPLSIGQHITEFPAVEDSNAGMKGAPRKDSAAADANTPTKIRNHEGGGLLEVDDFGPGPDGLSPPRRIASNCTSNLGSGSDSDIFTTSSEPTDVIELGRIPGKLIYLVGDDTQLMRVVVDIGNSPVTAVIDTGAASSLISDRLVRTMGLDIMEGKRTVEIIGKRSFEVLGCTTVPMEIHGVPMDSIHLIVFPEVISPVIDLVLGADFLRKNNIELCIRKRMLIKHFSDGGSTEIYLDKLGTPCNIMFCRQRCYAARDVHIMGGKTESVPITCASLCCEPNHMVLYSDGDIDVNLVDRLRGFAGVFDSDRKLVLMVASEGSTNIKRGQCVWDLFPQFCRCLKTSVRVRWSPGLWKD